LTSLPIKNKTSDKNNRSKAKRRRMNQNVNDNENVRPNDKEEENLSFTESSVQQEHMTFKSPNQVSSTFTFVRSYSIVAREAIRNETRSMC
jgi:hypothetical protein